MDLRNESGPAGTGPSRLMLTIAPVQEHPRILLAAPRSGSGKTLITCGLLDVLKRREFHVQAFKCGPDYIDPMFHEKVLGVPSVNLDTWFTGREGTIRLFEEHMADTRIFTDYEGDLEYGKDGESETSADIAVIEGVMGLYDGLGGITEEASSYELASVLKAPIILIVDAGGMGRSMIAEIRGFQSMDRNHLIAGVILNKTSAAFGKLMAQEIEKVCGIPVLGTFPKEKELHIDSRHLGLKLPDEIADLQKEVGRAGELLEQNVDIDRLLSVAGARQKYGGGRDAFIHSEGTSPEEEAESGGRNLISEGRDIYKTNQENWKFSVNDEDGGKIRIAVVRDEAFCFYYEDNLRLLEKLGAEIVPFSPIHDAHLPADIGGIYLGGGYPELKAAELSANQSMRNEIAAVIRSGMPSVAECGGFMYLQEYIAISGRKVPDENILSGRNDNSKTAFHAENPCGKKTESGINQNNRFLMAGLVSGGSHNTGRLVRFGYCSVKELRPHFLPVGKEIRGHEFHYYDSDDNGADCIAEKPVSGRSWNCIHETDHSFWGYPHLYWLSAPEFAEHFVKCCREFANHL